MSKSEQASPKFKVGQVWLNRSGVRVRLTQLSPHILSQMIYCCEESCNYNYCVYAATGRMLSADEHPLDLVSLAEDVPKLTLPLEVGKSYRTTNGIKATVDFISERKEATRPVLVWFEGSPSRLYRGFHRDGKYREDEVDAWDLVEDWED